MEGVSDGTQTEGPGHMIEQSYREFIALCKVQLERDMSRVSFVIPKVLSAPGAELGEQLQRESIALCKVSGSSKPGVRT